MKVKRRTDHHPSEKITDAARRCLDQKAYSLVAILRATAHAAHRVAGAARHLSIAFVKDALIIDRVEVERVTATVTSAILLLMSMILNNIRAAR